MKIFLALPNYDGTAQSRTMLAAFRAERYIKQVDVYIESSSALTFNFNISWCKVLNDPSYTHFAMLHSDIIPEQEDWLAKLMEAMRLVDADLISVVSPIKDDSDEVSTALLKIGEYNPRRLKMSEVRQLDETFNKKPAAHLIGWDYADCRLLVNTGCMLVNMRKRKVLEQMCFTVNNWIKKDDKGVFYPVFESEDWEFSRRAAENGLSVWVTRAVHITHRGGRDYNNW